MHGTGLPEGHAQALRLSQGRSSWQTHSEALTSPPPCSGQARRSSIRADYLTKLDQAIGDGDMGVTMRAIGEALLGYVDENEVVDIGQYLAKAGMLANKVGPSTMGTLLSTMLMRAGKAARGKAELTAAGPGGDVRRRR